MKKRILSLALAVFFIFALVPFGPTVIAENIPIAQANGFIAQIDNTVPPNAIRISTATELAQIGGVQSADMYYVLDNNINLTAEWVPIDNFHGTFDGRGFIVTNLYVLSGTNRQYAGLFSQASEYATIKNIGVNIGVLGISANKRNDDDYVGGVIGYSNGATITNCYATGTISGNGNYGNVYAGGLIGRSDRGSITDCYATGAVSASSSSHDSSSYAGGLIGYSGGGTVTNCYATGAITAADQHYDASSCAGGLIGYSSGITITNCYATGNIIVSSLPSVYATSPAYAGGLTGFFVGGIISNSYAIGDVSATSMYSHSRSALAGGLIGYFKDGATTICHATGRVYSNSDSSDGFAGGLIGYCDEGIITITNNYSTGVITTEGRSFAGGLIASRNDNCRITINNSYYSSQTIIGNQTKAIGEFISSWALEGTMNAVDKGFVPDEIQNNFTNVITRQEFCRMAVKWVEYATGKNIDTVMSEKSVSRNPNAFTDTSDSYILAAFALGITNGTGDNQFTPNGQLSREQAATMITNTCRAIGTYVDNPPPSGFVDLGSAASWAVNGINFVRANGIMQGTGNDNFSPSAPYTREQSIITFNNINHNTLPGR